MLPERLDGRVWATPSSSSPAYRGTLHAFIVRVVCVCNPEEAELYRFVRPVGSGVTHQLTTSQPISTPSESDPC
eukprot:scaffold24451_cov62-Phaeocystis_antarctica.AAC.1